MSDFGNFGYGSRAQYAKLSKVLLDPSLKQVSSDISNIIPITQDPTLVTPNARLKTPLYDELTKVVAPESTFRYNTETSDNFGKFTAEDNAATRFAAQKGTYPTQSYVATSLMSYVLNIGMIANKNSAGYLNLMANEQKLGVQAMRKGIERCLITGAVASATDGGVTDALAFDGLVTKITTNVQNLAGAAVGLDELDTAIDACIDKGALESNLIMLTDTKTITSVSKIFYNTLNMPMPSMNLASGMRVASYRGIPLVNSDYMPKTSTQRGIFVVDKESTVVPEFWPISQIDLGRTQLSDDSVMFWMGALAVKDETKNAWIKNIL